MRKILIIEDDSKLREMYKLIFRQKAYEVDEANNDVDAKEFLDRKTYDVILLDLLFPSRQDGVHLISSIRNKESPNKNTKIVVISNLDQGEKVKRALDLGADKYLFKAKQTPSSIYEEVNALINKSST